MSSSHTQQEEGIYYCLYDYLAVFALIIQTVRVIAVSQSPSLRKTRHQDTMILSLIFCIVLIYSMNIPHNTQKCHLMDFCREEWSICTVSSYESDHMCWPLADPENDRWFQGHALCPLIGCQLLIDILLFLFTGLLAVIIKLHLISVPVYFLFMCLMRRHTRSDPVWSTADWFWCSGVELVELLGFVGRVFTILR